jgi:hypothetical protein
LTGASLSSSRTIFDRFLSAADAGRALRTFRKLARHDISRWALTGGLATEIHSLRRGCPASTRRLNDIDFIAGSFDHIPVSLAGDFLFRHIHPLDPPGKTMLQLVDQENALRIDVFRACGATMSRTSTVDFPSGPMQLVSLEDLAARAARLAFDLAEGVPAPSKHAADFLRLAALADPAQVETAWRDHRKPGQPASFAEANGLLQHVIPARGNLPITPDYSKDAGEVCPRCKATAAFPLADPKLVLSILGYC